MGKTFAGSEKLMQLGAKVNLVVCQKSKISDWIDHFRQNYESWCDHIFDLTVTSQLDVCMWEWSEGNTCIGVINYDLIWRRPELLKLEDFTLLLDESSLIQNETAKRSKFILKLKPKNVVLLSGTPTGGKYEKLWSQMHLLGWKISKDLYWKQFVNVTYLDTVGRSVPIVTGYKNVDRLKRKMADFGCQFLKTDEVFDLPDQVFQKVKIQPSAQYKKFHKNSIVKLEDGTELVGDTTLNKMLYERMLCGHYSDAKLKAFSDLVESTEDRLVVFYNFTSELEAMMRIAAEHVRPFGVVNGSQKEAEMLEVDGAILFVQYQAGAMGLNLQKACRMIFFTPTLSCELWMQSQKRIHRLGQDKSCFYYLLMVTGSVEEKIYSALDRGVDFTEELFRKDES